MPRNIPENAEQVYISPEDADILERFNLRRSFNRDGSLRYVQVLGTAAEIDAFIEGVEPDYSKVEANVHTAYSLPRLIAQRMIGRRLGSDEVVIQTNGKKGDCRRSNIEISTKSDVARGDRDASWSGTGAKYVYTSSTGRYFVNVRGDYLGTFDDVDTAQRAIDYYHEALEKGMPLKEVKRQIKRKFNGDPGVLVTE